jgi:enterochelin esterase-like enzyme
MHLPTMRARLRLLLLAVPLACTGAVGSNATDGTGGGSGGTPAPGSGGSGGAPLAGNGGGGSGSPAGGAGGSVAGAPAAGSGGVAAAGGQGGAMGGATGGTTAGAIGTSRGGSSGGSAAGGSAATGGASAGGRGGGQAGGAGGAVDPGTDGDGDFTAGPTYTRQSDLTSKGAPAGRMFSFTMNSADSKIYTGLDTTLNSPRAFSRAINVYVPAAYKDGTAAPFMVIHDGPTQMLSTPPTSGALGNVRLALDNLTAATDPARRLPAFIAIAVANGGGDSLGSERGLEYDTMSDRFARFIDTEVLPAVLANAQIKTAYPNISFTTNPEGRGSIGCSSGGAAALTMAWFRPDLFRKAITYSGTFVDQQDTDAPEERMYPLGAWEYHSSMALIANSDPKPLRLFVNANDRDNGYSAPESGHHNWVIANERTAAALKSKGYHYRYVAGQNAGHCDGNVQNATLADTLVWIWRGYPID